MILRNSFVFLLAAMLVAGCTTESTESQAAAEDVAVPQNESVGILTMPGLTIKTLKNGYGREAVAGDLVSVHYTGWLFDESAEDSRGEKFDSSIGEIRELKIAPEMGYGDRGAGDVIPPGATLVFEVELKGLQGPNDQG
jgi:FKBP-type peptidyl-prolyl cis-trans isomerase